MKVMIYNKINILGDKNKVKFLATLFKIQVGNNILSRLHWFILVKRPTRTPSWDIGDGAGLINTKYAGMLVFSF